MQQFVCLVLLYSCCHRARCGPARTFGCTTPSLAWRVQRHAGWLELGRSVHAPATGAQVAVVTAHRNSCTSPCLTASILLPPAAVLLFRPRVRLVLHVYSVSTVGEVRARRQVHARHVPYVAAVHAVRIRFASSESSPRQRTVREREPDGGREVARHLTDGDVLRAILRLSAHPCGGGVHAVPDVVNRRKRWPLPRWGGVLILLGVPRRGLFGVGCWLLGRGSVQNSMLVSMYIIRSVCAVRSVCMCYW